MSYSIHIGEATISAPTHNENASDAEQAVDALAGQWEDDFELYVSVDGLAVDEAPEFPGDGMTGKGNSRHPGYSQWGDFLKECGLHDLFMDTGHGLMRAHPGAMLLRPSHLSMIRGAIASWQQTHPDADPGWCSCGRCSWNRESHDAHIPGRDTTLARLLWLDWWVAWALAHCKVPTVYNH